MSITRPIGAQRALELALSVGHRAQPFMAFDEATFPSFAGRDPRIAYDPGEGLAALVFCEDQIVVVPQDRGSALEFYRLARFAPPQKRWATGLTPPRPGRERER